MVQYYQPHTILELGTSFGITSSYLASGKPNATVFTCEGAKSIAAIAAETFDHLQLQNIRLQQGDFAVTLPSLLAQLKQLDLVFIDGNHRKEPTIQYFLQLLPYATDDTILIFDDIHWSAGMEAAWVQIQQHPQVTLTIDLFFIGIVVLNPNIKVPQHFTIRF
jgi:predicted O-methyltransferase YrrM